RAIHFETGNTQFQKFSDAFLPVCASGGVREIDHRIVVTVRRTNLAGEGVTLRRRFLHHLSLKEWRDPKHGLGLVTVKPLHHTREVRQTNFINIEVIVTPRLSGSPWTIDPVHTIRNSERAHHQHVFHDFGIEWGSNWRTVVVSRALRVFVAPAPGSVDPFRRQERWTSVERVLAYERCRI